MKKELILLGDISLSPKRKYEEREAFLKLTAAWNHQGMGKKVDIIYIFSS